MCQTSRSNGQARRQVHAEQSPQLLLASFGQAVEAAGKCTTAVRCFRCTLHAGLGVRSTQSVTEGRKNPVAAAEDEQQGNSSAASQGGLELDEDRLRSNVHISLSIL